MSRPLSWLGIVRMGLVQTGLGAIVVLTTSTLNRVMVVELALPALLTITSGKLELPPPREPDRAAGEGKSRGQFLDLQGGARSPEEIATTNELKTGVLLGAAVDMAAITAETDDCVAQALRNFALAAGHAFQIRDDFQDGPGMDSAVTGKDTGKDIGKATLINTLGFKEARRRLMEHLLEADRCLTDAIGSKVHRAAQDRGLFSRLRGESVFCLAPPVVITEAQIDRTVSILADSVKAVLG